MGILRGLAVVAIAGFSCVPLAAQAQHVAEAPLASSEGALSAGDEQVDRGPKEPGVRQLRGVLRSASEGPQLDAAIEGLTALANSGDGDAAFALGEHYRRGDPPDLGSAARFYHIASSSNVTALVRLGDIYLSGETSEFAPPDSVGLFEEAAGRGSVTALSRLGDIYARGDIVTQDVPRAVDYFTQAYDAGEVRLARRLGDFYRRGEAGLDRAAALPYYEVAAAAGDAAAMMFIGDYYRDGLGVAADPLKAEAYYQQAIEAGRPQALARLVKGLRAGTVGQGGTEAANAMLEQGVADGNATAALLLSNALINGQDVEPDLARALALLEGAGNDVEAQLRLIDLLTGGGRNIAPDASRAKAALDRVRDQLDADEAALAELVISAARRPGLINLADIGAAFAALPEDRRREAIERLYRLNQNAYVVALQGLLARNEYYDGTLSGQLTMRTIGGLYRLCEAKGILENCRKGPMLPSVMKAIADVI